MPLSRYLKIIPHPEKPDRTLLFSTRRTALLELPTALLATLPEQGREAGLAPLFEHQVLVDDPAQEREEMLGFVDRVNRLSATASIAVILGMACNFACGYCYEGTQKGAAAMREATAEQLVAFLGERFAGPGRKLIIDFYGGEPLLYRSRIRELAGRLKSLIEAEGGEFAFTLVTNGSLLRPEVAEELAALGLTAVKVTLDGPPQTHDRMRPFKDGRPSFATIVDNLAACHHIVPIAVAGNFSRGNFRRFPELLDYLEEAGLGPARLKQVKFNPVLQTTDAFAPGFCGGCASINEPWLAEATLFLRQAVLARGYTTPKVEPSLCMVDKTDSFTVHYDGSLYKCVSMIGHTDYACGDIWQGLDEGYRGTYCTGHWQREEECRECVYLPLCFGGCRYMAFQRDGHMGRVDCQKAFLDATLETMLRQDLCHRYGKTG